MQRRGNNARGVTGQGFIDGPAQEIVSTLPRRGADLSYLDFVKIDTAAFQQGHDCTRWLRFRRVAHYLNNGSRSGQPQGLCHPGGVADNHRLAKLQ